MDFLLLSAFYSNEAATAEVRFEVSINQAPTQVFDGLANVQLPSTPRPLPVSIRVVPTTPHYWPVEGSFEYQGNGSLSVLDAPAEFRPPRGFAAGGNGAVSMIVYLARVRDRTAEVMASLGNVPPVRLRPARHPPLDWPPPAWGTPGVLGFNFIEDPPVLGRDLNFLAGAIDPGTDDMVLEVANVNAPGLLAVSWPLAVARRLEAGPTPFLIYFHPNVGQNAPEFYTARGVGTYPFGWDYLFYGLWRYMNYIGDPVSEDPFAKGLPYQLAASGKQAVVVLPSNKVGPEVGVFLSAASAEELLMEIRAFFFRRAGIYTAPLLGRTALASFSAGNLLVSTFLGRASNRSHPFYLNTLKELYMFDVPGSFIPGWVGQAMQWATSGASADKMIRCYTRGNSSSYASLLGRVTNASAPFALSSADGLRTAVVLPDPAWARTVAAAGVINPRIGFQESHQLISATMLTDALRRSGF